MRIDIDQESVRHLATLVAGMGNPPWFKRGKRKIYNPTGFHWFFCSVLQKQLTAQYGGGSNWAVTGKGVVPMALQHSNKRFVASTDVKSFFDSCRIEHVAEFFDAEDIETIKLCYIDGRLPHGYLTSSTLADLSLYHFDIAMTRYATENDLSFTRYCDDIYISGRRGAWKALKFLSESLPSGIKTSEKKTKVMPAGTLHMVLGVNVDHKKGWTPMQRRYMHDNYKNSYTKYLLDRGKQIYAFQ